EGDAAVVGVQALGQAGLESAQIDPVWMRLQHREAEAALAELGAVGAEAEHAVEDAVRAEAAEPGAHGATRERLLAAAADEDPRGELEVDLPVGELVRAARDERRAVLRHVAGGVGVECEIVVALLEQRG